MPVVMSFVTGLMFAIGLGISGMTRPLKVVDFLDVGGSWDPSLAMVMIGAIAVYAISYRLIVRRSSPVFGGLFQTPAATSVDARLLGGAAVFGTGWGLSGYCPGPALTALGGAGTAALWFVPSMAAGMLLCRWWFPSLAERAAGDG